MSRRPVPSIDPDSSGSRRPVPRIVSRNPDGFFDDKTAPQSPVSSNASGNGRASGATVNGMVRNSQGIFVPAASLQQSPREPESLGRASERRRDPPTRRVSTDDVDFERRDRDERRRDNDERLGSSSTRRQPPRDSRSDDPPTAPARSKSKRRPNDDSMPPKPSSSSASRSKSVSRKDRSEDTESSSSRQALNEVSSSRRDRNDNGSAAGSKSDAVARSRSKHRKHDENSDPARSPGSKPERLRTRRSKDEGGRGGTEGGGDDEMQDEIAKARAKRNRQSQYMKSKKKDEETIRREKEERAERKAREKEKERKALEKKELERRLAEIERGRIETEQLSREEEIIVPDYAKALIRMLLNDATLSPSPDDFAGPDGFDSYQRKFHQPLQEILADFISERYIDGPNRRGNAGNTGSQTTTAIFFKVVEATNIYFKDNGKPRECYCRIEFGECPDDGASGSRNTETFETETLILMKSPFKWNQHLNIDAKSILDTIIVSVWDRRKDDFLGQVVLKVGDIVQSVENDGYVSKWCNLSPREGKSAKKDKYVGGEILLEFNIDRSKTEASKRNNNRTEYNENELISYKLNFMALYKLLLKACLLLDMGVIEVNENTTNLQSTQSEVLLWVYGRRWAIGEAAQHIALVGLLFNKYKEDYDIPVNALFTAYESIYDKTKANPNWISKYEKPTLADLSDQMHDYYCTQVKKYKEFFPKNRPNGALDNTILMWRMVFKSQIYRENHPDLPLSFRDHIKTFVKASFESRYEQHFEQTSAIDESDFEAVVEGLVQLADKVMEELEVNAKYFREPFRKDLDIISLAAEIYIGSYTKAIENQQEFFSSAEGVAAASKGIFELLKKIRVMDLRLAKIVPNYPQLNAEKIFSLFVLKWLDYLNTKTVEWVANALKVDNFEPVENFDYERGGAPHSSSVMDVFTAINNELSFIIELNWSNKVQSAGFFQKFSKTIYTAIENYCDFIGNGELRPLPNAGKWGDLLKLRSQKLGPKDIASESCIKLCNIEFALEKLHDLTRIMNVGALSQTTKDYRATIAPKLNQKGRGKSNGADKADPESDEFVRGAFKVEVMYAENLKPVTSAGLAHAYVSIKVPEGTVVPPPEALDVTGIDAGSPEANKPLITTPATPMVPEPPKILKGSTCEMARTRVISDSINPSWDEEFSFILPPVDTLRVVVYSKTIIGAIATDPIVGEAKFDLGVKSRLKRKLADHHTHDIFLELEPQGRILLRLTLEGEEEDVEFWFRRTREMLGRTRNDFVRSLAGRISPYSKEVLVGGVKEQEAAVIPQGYFSAFQKTLYSNVTAAGVEITKPVSPREADEILAPLTDYLNKNMQTLFTDLSPKMATEVSKRIWEDTLLVIETALIPPLFGQIEKDRRVLNKRQCSLLDQALAILCDFFYAGGDGIPTKTLENRRYSHCQKLIKIYDRELRKLKADYEASLLEGREKEYVLKLIRMRFEKQEDLTQGERDDGRKWFDVQLVNRKERA